MWLSAISCFVLVRWCCCKSYYVVLDVPLNKVKKYAQKGPITAKDVVKMHNILKRVKTLKDFLDSPL